MNRTCPKHGIPMMLLEVDRGGEEWGCSRCSVEIARETRRDMVIEEFQKVCAAAPIGGDVTLPRFLIKWAIRSLKDERDKCSVCGMEAHASPCV